ncbi:hypothetical protein VCR31J2_1300120 [Vibrio coralliirubri]|uniref:Uncharacterized protein n=1 Tax=Vibrio coralliirubri TaxID=1516159 RepID=A0AA86X146_9VIBR|nr:hypothetical protein VCR31J2_1300120 [Vibrio coralliirubri]CDT91301.1 hypothetical protein VCR29J2_80069 [Vibrio coralliirubri]
MLLTLFSSWEVIWLCGRTNRFKSIRRNDSPDFAHLSVVTSQAHFFPNLSQHLVPDQGELQQGILQLEFSWFYRQELIIKRAKAY